MPGEDELVFGITLDLNEAPYLKSMDKAEKATDSLGKEGAKSIGRITASLDTVRKTLDKSLGSSASAIISGLGRQVRGLEVPIDKVAAETKELGRTLQAALGASAERTVEELRSGFLSLQAPLRAVEAHLTSVGAKMRSLPSPGFVGGAGGMGTGELVGSAALIGSVAGVITGAITNVVQEVWKELKKAAKAVFDFTVDTATYLMMSADNFSLVQQKAGEVQEVVDELAQTFGGQLNQAVLDAINTMGGMEGVRSILTTVFDIITQIGTRVISLGGEVGKTAADWIHAQGGVVAVHYHTVAAIEQVSVALHVMAAAGHLAMEPLITSGKIVYATFVSVKNVLMGIADAIGTYLYSKLGEMSAAFRDWLSIVAKFGVFDEEILSAAGALDRFTNESIQASEGHARRQIDRAFEIGKAWFDAGTSITSALESSRESMQRARTAGERVAQAWVDAKYAAAEYEALANRIGVGGAPVRQVFPGSPGSSDYLNFDGGEGSPYSPRDPATGLPVPFQYRQAGGEIYGAAGTDRVPAMLTAGEFVVQRRAAQANLSFLQALNAGRGSSPRSIVPGGSQAPSSTVPGGGGVVNLTVTQNFHEAKMSPQAIADGLARLARQGKKLGG